MGEMISNIKDKKNKSQVDKVYKKVSGRTLYFSAVGIFLFAVIFICLSPHLFGKNYDYETVKLNELQEIGSLNLSVADMQINRDTGLFKIVVKYQSESEAKSLSNLTCKYKLNFINNKNNTDVKTKVIKISDEYTVIYYENLPKDFGVISLTVMPRYVYPEIEPANDLDDKEYKFYAVDDKIKGNNNLKIEDMSDLKLDSLNYEIASVKRQISEENKKIKTLNLSNKVIKEDIDKLEKQKELKTLDEQAEEENNINSLEVNMQNNDAQIKESKKKLEEYNNRIEELEKNAACYN